jgi:hypothetical protein
VGRRLRSESRVEFYSRWYQARYKSGDLNGLIEFAWKFPQIAKSARWYRDAVGDLISILVADRKRRRESLRKIASLLNRMRIPARRADKWYASAVRLYARRSPNKSAGTLRTFRILRAIYGPRRQNLSWVESVIKSGETKQDDVRLLWDIHRFLKDPFRVLRQDILSRFRLHERHIHADKTIPRRERLVSYVGVCWGTRELPNSTLRPVLLTKGSRDHGILDDLFFQRNSHTQFHGPHLRGFLDQPLRREDLIILVTGRLDTAVTKILSRWFGISLRSAYRYKPVQKPPPPGSITVTPLDPA